MSRNLGFLRSAAVAAFLLLAAPATAQPRAEGFGLDRFEPSERGSDWFVLESLDLRDHGRFAAGLVLDYAHKPLVLYSAEGDEVASIVSSQIFAHVGSALVLWDRARFALNLPIAVFQDGESGTAGNTNFSSDNATTFGDMRFGADARLAGKYGEAYTLAGGVQLHAPTGSQASYTGDGAVRFVPRLALAGELGDLVYASMLGVVIRGNNNAYAGSPRGSEIAFSAALGGKALDDKMMVGVELSTGTVIADADAFFARRTTPLELLLGWHFRATDSVRINAGAGPGLTRAFGTPQFRAVLSVEWFAPVEEVVPPADRDGDTILDSEDACPDVPGVRTTDPKTNGCPPPEDRDKDGVLDDVDACPDVPGVATDDPKTNGCPDRDKDKIPDSLDACPDVPGVATSDPKTNGCPDRDKDGIPDDVDACPDEPGVASDDPKKHGCPLPKDTDGDGIVDPEDACPKDPGPANQDPKKHGCPVARVEKGQIIIREQVQFAYNSDRILKASDFILEAVQKILDDNAEIRKVSVEGHTDSKGGNAYNKGLSVRRAKSVMRWLVKAGIKQARLEAHGFGEERPIETNDTEEGRANNRRVEFHIRDQASSEETPKSVPKDETKKPAPKDEPKKTTPKDETKKP